MSVFTRDNAVRLLGLLKKEIEAFEQILGLTEKQTELLAADDIEEFNKLLESRQVLIGKINGLHQESDILMQSYNAYTSAPGKKRVKEVESASKQLREIIEKCIQLNEKNTGTAKGIIEGYSEQIEKLSTTRKGLESYIIPVENESEMFDKMT